mgnify:CR=1 FL=1
MSISYGFYNSVNHDRRYNANQMASIFDGVITDGVYHSIGDAFSVTPGTGMNVNVAPGRAWFDHTWTSNDSILVVELTAAHQVYDRIDAIVLRVDGDKRTNSIVAKAGAASSAPVKPTMTNDDDKKIHEHPLAYVRVNHGTTDIKPANIQFVVGTSECPFVAGVQNGVDIDALVANWKLEFDILFAKLEDQISQAVSGTLIDGSVTYEKLAPDAVRRRFENVSVPVASFISDTTYADYPYRATIPLAGVIASMVPDVTFSIAALADCEFAPVAECYAGGIYIYASSAPTAAVLINSVVCWR